RTFHTTRCETPTTSHPTLCGRGRPGRKRKSRQAYDLIPGGIEMPMLDLKIRHRPTLDDARRGLELAVQRVSGQFGPLVRRVEWAPDRYRVKLDGAGFWVEMWVDAQDVHATGDIPILAGLLGSQLGAGL